MVSDPLPLEERVERLAVDLGSREIDVLLVSAPLNVRYACGYTGSNGVALVGAQEHGGVRSFFTDFRYAAQSAAQVPEQFARTIVNSDLLEAAAASLSGRGRLGFDDEHLAVKQHVKLSRALPDGWSLLPCAGAVEALREVKDPAELKRMRAACALVDDVLGEIVKRGLAGRSEREVALALEYEMRVHGAQSASFPSIVASGPHGALPHAEPRDVAIERGVLVTIDLGAVLDGYCSDCTRTFAVGEPDGQAREIYEIVLRAQEAAVAALAPGRSGPDVDAVARSVIEAAGYGEYFGHGLGHGVGLDIHEAPRLSRRAGKEPLVAGNVVSVEPGIYLPERLGVRIEDLMLVTAQGSEALTHYPKDLISVD